LVSRTGQHPATTAALDEASLIDKARAGDRDAQEVLVARHLGEVYGLAYRILGDRDVAQDAAQDALVNALNGLARFRGESSFRTWLLRITVNAARSHSRRRWRRREVTLTLAEDVASDARDPASVTAALDEAGRASQMLERLPRKQRLAVVLRATQGLSYQEVAAILECSEGAARVNYHLGIKRLRELLR
jgi:RNA polymerase sigma-70 factor (ECF subfamily)